MTRAYLAGPMTNYPAYNAAGFAAAAQWVRTVGARLEHDEAARRGMPVYEMPDV